MLSGRFAVAGLLLALLPFTCSADDAISTLYISATQTTFSINLSPNSTDFNFYLSAPSWYSWFGVGFGSEMANTLMLVVYSAADNQHVTVSPRLATGDTEPPYYPGASITLLDGSSLQNGSYVISGVCHGCLRWPSGEMVLNSTVTPFTFALGPNDITLASDDLAAPLKRHIGYGHFTMNTIQATGPGGVPVSPPAITDGASLAGNITDDSDNAHTGHGLVMVIATVAVAPVDAITASALRRWPVLHMITSTGYLLFVVAGMVLGVMISKEYIITQNYTTGHQLLGFIIVGLMLIIGFLGAAHRLIIGSAARREQHPPEKSSLLRRIHLWGGRLIWILMVINTGVGLQLDQARQSFIIGFAVLAVGVAIVMAPIYFCIWRFSRRKREEKEEENDAAHQLAQLYAPH